MHSAMGVANGGISQGGATRLLTLHKRIEAQEMAFQTLSLADAGEFDGKNGLKEKLTGWGKICKLRAESGNSRKARIKKDLTKSGKAK